MHRDFIALGILNIAGDPNTSSSSMEHRILFQERHGSLGSFVTHPPKIPDVKEKFCGLESGHHSWFRFHIFSRCGFQNLGVCNNERMRGFSDGNSVVHFGKFRRRSEMP